jgi:hypothetical protein
VSTGNPLPAETFEFLSDRSMPAFLEVERDGPRIRVFDQEHMQDREPPLRRSWVLATFGIAFGAACVWALREGWIAAAFILLVPAVLCVLGWYTSDADFSGRQLHLDFEHDTATLILAGARRRHRRTLTAPIEAVRLILCPVKGFFRTEKGQEVPTFTGVGVFAVVPSGDPERPGWMMLAGEYDYRKLLEDLAERLPEFAAPEQYWQPIRGQLDRALL